MENLLTNNPGFESGLSGWSQTFGSGGFTVTSAKKYSGAYSLKLTDTSTTQNPGMESAKFPITPGYNYTVSAMVQAESGKAEVYIRFYNASGTYLSSSYVSTATPVGSWVRIGTVGHAPDNATHASVLLYSGKAATATVYYDDVVVKRSFAKIGPQLPYVSQVVEGAVGTDSTGKAWVYTVTRGRPAQLAVIDPVTLVAVKKLPLPDAEGAAAVTISKDGDVYVGGYGGSTYGEKATLYRYTPGANSVVALGQPIPEQSRIEDLTPGVAGKVYGTTSNGGYVFKYETWAGVTQFGGQVITGVSAIRGAVFDEATKMLYLAGGPHIVKYDTTNGNNKTELLSPTYAAGVSEVYTLDLVGGKLFAKLNYEDGSTKTLVMNKTTGTVEDSFVAGSRGVFYKDENSDVVYYSSGGKRSDGTVYSDLYSYTISTKQKSAALGSLGGLNMVGASVVPMPGGEALVGLVGNLGKLFTYQNGVVKLLEVGQMPGIINDIRQFQKGPNGKLYMGGFLTNAGLAVFDPNNPAATQTDVNLSQVDAIGQLGNTMYFGVYPNARLHSVDTTVSPLQTPVNRDPGDVLSKAGQDRITAIQGHAGTGGVYLGTVPKRNQYGAGKMWVFNPANGSFTPTRVLVPNHSIVTLIEHNGKLFGGTSSWGGSVQYGGEYGRVFCYNPATDTLEFVKTPVSQYAVIALVAGPDGNIWGLNQGYVFAVDATSGATVYTSANLFLNMAGRIGGAEMVVGNDGKIYVALGAQTTAGTDKILQIDPATKAIVTLREDITGGGSLTKDDNGDIYYGDEMDLWKLELK